MSERHKPHNGRDISGNYRVRQADLDELVAQPDGEKYLRDDVRLGGAVADIGPRAGSYGERIGSLIEQNHADVARRSSQATRGESLESGDSSRF
jgi:hypothetical protein